ncbi:serine protease HtrA [Campylobacter molothri]|uniref:DegQ family serine endoprotease n=1 Tax=Campylobacter molothri TaxID=1032242 RepID=A0ACC5W195_9BACT|nr:DegQ family serine endoprotease [Campylobacter sp. RM10537]MBZ7928376.1 DegQ family serine endoprotease [Campylobacter sp. RM10542]MBZ7929483.1 DegQ family serine endoprotease [Campylobacter sp. W0067]MBZ7932793.1 DegQ family serine endoprotease [Campylobacter sp. RM10543]MBZ7949403.1 DegQ family serine endoprotease [Campylobacter sp. RM10534]MBZ7958203.1 DegQ family serine endoprotease [Campylobacter sp. RM9760]MBZ7960737.1 DegQ family serine endoprotease [Campylobacter sp. RM9930]MBZ796
MKKIFLSIGLASVLFAANINFNESTSSANRVNPADGGVILSYHDSIKDAKKSVVNISTSKTITRANSFSPLDDFFDDPYFKQFFDIPQRKNKNDKEVISSLGSGVIISKDGYIVTNNHVVEDADTITVNLPGSDTEYKAKLIGKDPKTDLAVIKIDAKNLSAITFANSDNLMEGDVVFALGNPFGVGFSVTSGIISALNKDNIGLNQYENFIQTDASINPGNSGGALVDSRGFLVGINSAILSRGGGNNGIGFAIPSNMVKDIAKKLIEKGKIERGFLGVTISALQGETKKAYKNQEGALITDVQKGSSADEAGLKRGDLVTKVNGKVIKNPIDLKNYIGTLDIGEKVTIDFERDGNNKQVSFILKGEKENKGVQNNLIEGLSLRNLDPRLKDRLQLPRDINGVLVEKVKSKSKADEAGFKEGDVIVGIGQGEIKNLKDLDQALKQANKKEFIKIWVYRNGFTTLLVLR